MSAVVRETRETRVFDGLRVVARAPDGIVEAVEGVDDGRFVVGVQFHPERLLDTDPRMARLFEDFVSCAREYRAAVKDRH